MPIKTKRSSYSNSTSHKNSLSFVSSLKDGMGFGAGSSIAHNTIGRLFQQDQDKNETKINKDCKTIISEYKSCLDKVNYGISASPICSSIEDQFIQKCT